MNTKVDKTRVFGMALMILAFVGWFNWMVSIIKTQQVIIAAKIEQDRQLEEVRKASVMMNGCFTDFEANKQLGVECAISVEQNDVLAKD